MKTLFESVHARLELDEARHIVRFTRSDVPFATVAEATDVFRTLAHTFSKPESRIDRTRLSLLTDLRAAHGRNDPEFEKAIARYRAELFEGFARRATIVKTVAGALQVQRLGREQHTPDVRVFQDEAEALAYLTAR